MAEGTLFLLNSEADKRLKQIRWCDLSLDCNEGIESIERGFGAAGGDRTAWAAGDGLIRE